MRSVIKLANEEGIREVVDQQFGLGLQIAKKGLVPILEPEVDIHSPEKEKAEKKAQAKKAKAEKKAQKAKKPKKPKEPDNTPPLPKKPVVLIMVMAASFLALVLVGTNLFGYTLSFNNAKQAYELGDYQAAFADVSGLTVKEADQETYQKYSIMANAAGEYQAYQTFMENGIYDMALDSLIRAVGRCDKYSEEAAAYGCSTELAKIRDQAVAGLSGFGLTQERAQERYWRQQDLDDIDGVRE